VHQPSSRSLLLCTLLLAACDRGSAPASAGYEPRPPPKPAPAPTATWSDDGYAPKLEFEGSAGDFTADVDGSYGDLLLSVRASQVPDGTVIRYGDKIAKIDNGYGSLEAPLDYPFGSVELKDAIDYKRKVDIGLEFQIELPRHEPATIQLPPISLRQAASSSFEEVAKGSVEFAGEPEDDGQRETLVQFSIGSSIEEVFGPGKLVQDIDLVAIEEKIETDERKLCKGYTTGSIDFSIVHSTLRVYDRRTGELTAETTLEPANKCPSMTMTTGGEASLWVSQDAKSKWLRGLIEPKGSKKKAKK
jgi:hypothetical protein